MRKRTIISFADQLFWLLVALMPLLLYCVQFFAYRLTSTSDTLSAFLPFMENLGLSETSIVYTSLVDLFGAEGILPLFSQGNNAVVLYLSYFVTVQIVHLAVDFLLFIPKLSHKWLEKLTCAEV